MTIESLLSQLDAFDQPALYQPDNFQRRAEVIDAIAFETIDRIDGLLGYSSQPRKLRSLWQSAVRQKRRLLAVDERLFHDLRSVIRGGCRGQPLRHLIERLVGVDAAGDQGQAAVGYASLDRLVTGLLDNGAFPEPRHHPEPGMVLYQRTPAHMYCDYCATTPQSTGETRLATASGQWSPDHLLGDLPNLVSGRDTAEPLVSRVLSLDWPGSCGHCSRGRRARRGSPLLPPI